MLVVVADGTSCAAGFRMHNRPPEITLPHAPDEPPYGEEKHHDQQRSEQDDTLRIA